MNVYRGCIIGFFFVFIGIVSIVLSRAMGLFGLLLPPALVAFAYLLVDSILVELIWWDRDHNS